MPRIKKSLANITAVKLKTLLLFLTIGSFCNVLAQAPNISYTTPQVYNVGTAISVLQPVNIGGAVTSNTNYQVTTFAGSGSFTSADGTGTAASFSFPRSIAIDPSGNIFVADVNSSLIRKITPAGIVSTFAGHGVGSFANGVGYRSYLSRSIRNSNRCCRECLCS